jgi:peptidoglycan/xylan/chitin deacetylase (PgdA/CDA1 family)
VQSRRGGIVPVRASARQVLKRSYFQGLGAARVDRIIRLLRARRSQVVVLNLHRVSPDPSPYWPPLPPAAFEQLVAYLAATCDVLTFAELARGLPSDRLRVVLSFDDGCRDFVDYGMPILARRQLRANHNVIVESVETGRPPWIIAVMDALNAASTARVRALKVPGFLYSLESDDNLAKVRYGTLLANYLKATPLAERESVRPGVNELLAETDPVAWTPMMSLEETLGVAEVHEVGSHSYSHESMALLSDSDFGEDLDRCAAFFAANRLPMKIFAFPNGSYRTNQVEALQARGIEHVLLVENKTSTATRGVHPRITMYGDTAAELRLRAMGWRPPSRRSG